MESILRRGRYSSANDIYDFEESDDAADQLMVVLLYAVRSSRVVNRTGYTVKEETITRHACSESGHILPSNIDDE